MTSFKKTTAVLLFSALAVFCGEREALADVLLWQVKDNPLTADTVIGAGTNPISWEWALLKVTDSATAEGAIYGGAESTFVSSFTSESDSDKEPAIHSSYFGDPLHELAAADLSEVSGDMAAKSFYIELYNSDFMLVGYSSAQTYTELEQFRQTASQLVNWTSVNAWGGTNWTAVPEPSSGLLIVLGLMVAGLKRRKFE